MYGAPARRRQIAGISPVGNLGPIVGESEHGHLRGAAAAISVRGLFVERGGREVLHGLALEVAAGSVTGLLGPSGCGKSTLMRAIVGVQIVVAGAVEVLGEEAGSKGLRRRVGYVTQAPSVYGDLSVAENLRYFGAIVGASPGRIAATVGAVGLGGMEERLVGSLSGGQRARVSLASALLGEPEVLVLDEPTVGLDPVLRAELWRIFHELARGGTTLLVSSHVMDEAGECDELLLMRDGRMLARETPDALRRQTGESDLGRAFLAVIERAEGG
ncbi:MAG TPA: ABC transporter ATP-binding protein [Solirubrobacterales bacterium]|nr:ABC transporter ATP-binding protein [Solirubrobacterales bacterium]